MKNNNKPQNRWSLIQKIFAAIGALSAIVTLLITTYHGLGNLQQGSVSYKIEQEEKMVESLIPGESFSRIQNIIGVPENYKHIFDSGNCMYQYKRPWEIIQVLVGPNENVLSIGVYAIDFSFQPKLGVPGAKFSLNKTRINEVLPRFSPDRIMAYFGAHQGGYFESYDDMPNAFNAQDFVVGIYDGGIVRNNIKPVWNVLDSISGCSEDILTTDCAELWLSSPHGQDMRKNTNVSFFIMSAPTERIIPDMLYTPINML